MESITLSDYFAKVLIDEDARLNLAEAFSRGPGNEEEEVPAEEDSNQAPEASAEEKKSGAAEVNIGKVILQGGQVDFTDRSLPWPFHADMRKLGGRI